MAPQQFLHDYWQEEPPQKAGCRVLHRLAVTREMPAAQVLLQDAGAPLHGWHPVSCLVPMSGR
ncbi:MAG: hypothetical protein Q8O64_19360 [Sideroxyarcus sp.]|nr:hypothetical protein [Sideroxyarcus sp.]